MHKKLIVNFKKTARVVNINKANMKPEKIIKWMMLK